MTQPTLVLLSTRRKYRPDSFHICASCGTKLTIALTTPALFAFILGLVLVVTPITLTAWIGLSHIGWLTDVTQSGREFSNPFGYAILGIVSLGCAGLIYARLVRVVPYVEED